MSFVDVEGIDYLVFDVHAVDQGHGTLWRAYSFPRFRLVEFDFSRYEPVGMNIHGSPLYQLKREYWPRERRP